MVHLFLANLNANPLQKQLKTFTPKDLEYAQVGFRMDHLETQETLVAMNEKMRFMPASTIKMFTAIAALKLLPEDFVFTTTLKVSGHQEGSKIQGTLCFCGNGDPYLTNQNIDCLLQELNKRGVRQFEGKIAVQQKNAASPWVGSKGLVEDHENYYAPKVYPLNFNRNRYPIRLKQGSSVGEPSTIVSIDPQMEDWTFQNFVYTGQAKTGDQAYIFKSPEKEEYEIRGSLSIDFPEYTIYGRLPNPPRALAAYVQSQYFPNTAIEEFVECSNQKTLLEIVHQSPPLSSIITDMLKRSDNLIAESLGSHLHYAGESGKDALQAFWREKGIKGNLEDCSGLSLTSYLSCDDMRAALNWIYSDPNFPQICQLFSSKEILLDNGKLLKVYYKSGSMKHIATFLGFAIIDSDVYSFSFLVNQTKLKKTEVFRWVKDVLCFYCSSL